MRSLIFIKFLFMCRCIAIQEKATPQGVTSITIVHNKIHAKQYFSIVIEKENKCLLYNLSLFIYTRHIAIINNALS